MAMSEVAVLGAIVIMTATKIQELGNNWYRASESWTEFPRKLELLKKKNDFWQAEFTKYGMSKDKAIIETLREAKLLLVEELGERSKAANSGWWAKLTMTMFPDKLGRSIDKVIRAFDDIEDLLRMEEVSTTLEKRELRRPFSMSAIRKDDRYVPLEVTQSAVLSALDKVDVDGTLVILLHGGPGKGKSTLARAVALHYTEAANKAAEAADMAAVFEHVVYLECGPKAEILEKQFKLLQLLGSDAAAPQEEACQFGSFSDLAIPRRLNGLLRDRKLLIIFDDVWEPGFLQSMVDLCGRRVKCLVTSQLGDLCRGLNCSSIDMPIEDVKQEDARKILASHVGLPHQHIPQHLEKIADKIIRETRGNPLALASIATAIHPTRSDELDAWEAATVDLYEMLHHETSAHILSMKYPRSFWSTMKLSFEALHEDAQKLLILVHMSDGISVPEEVIHLFYRSTKARGGSAAFARLRNELESRELVKVTLVSENPEKQRSWSVHSLQKRFIEEELKDARESTFTSLEGLSNVEVESTIEVDVVREASVAKETIMITLAALYFDYQFAKRAASKLNIPFERFNNLRRSAIEPVTRLLGQPLSDRWTETLCSSAERVFVGYICSGAMNDDDISDLLLSPVSSMAMISALEGVAILGETILDENKHGFIKALIDLAESVDFRIQMAVGSALLNLCRNELHCTIILNKLPSVMETIVRVLSTDSDPIRLSSWAGLLGNLSSSKVDASRIVGQYPGALMGLLKSLLEIYNLSRCDLFLRNHFLGSPTTAAFPLALANLAMGDDDTKLIIVNFHGVIEGLVELLAADNNPELQLHAARALAVLSCGNSETKSKIAHSHMVVEELVKSLSKDDNQGFQWEAARALVFLSDGNDETKLKIAHSLGAIEQFVMSLSKDYNPELQLRITTVLWNLASGDQDIKLKIVNSHGALEELAELLCKDTNRDLQMATTYIFGNLTSGDDKVKLKIVDSHRTVQEFVKLLSKDDNPELQIHIALALCNLASGEQEVKLKITNSVGILEEIAKVLSKDTNCELQRAVAQTFANLAVGDDEVKIKIIDSHGAIEQLAKSLSKDDNPNLQKQAARALAILIDVDAGMKLIMKIANSNSVVEELIKSLSKDGNPNLQEFGAKGIRDLALGMLFNIGVQEVDFSTLKLNHYAGRSLLHGLRGLMANNISPRTQRFAACALALIYPREGNEVVLQSGSAYEGRGYAKMLLGLYKESMADFDKAIDAQQRGCWTLSNRCFVRAKLGDYQQALADANNAVESVCMQIDLQEMGTEKSFMLQERGVLKHMMGDFHGALADLDEALDIETDDYEVLKHRGYVKFLMNDVAGAGEDAKWALRIKPSRVDRLGYGRACLGTSSVEYMGYKLR